MAEELDRHELPPDPGRLIEGLRDTGYQFVTALADIVDNSVAADATVIDVVIRMDYRGRVTVAVCDNGCGMDYESLLNAMRYGSRARDNKQSLGKFGLGLKTASTACCRRLSVLSRPSGEAMVRKAVWDLDHVADVAKWELLMEEPNADELALLDSTATESSGTVVMWEKCDRVLKQEYKNPTGRPAQKALSRLVTDFSEHAAAVYQRFLDPKDTRAANVNIRVNGASLPPWDPFCLWSESTEVVASSSPVAQLPDGSDAAFSVEAYVLPRKDELATAREKLAAKISNDLQGIYIYRENRLIHSGDWLGMYQKEPHFSLLRVDFSFDHQLDEAFNVDIKKSQVLLNESLYEWLKEQFLPAPRRAAEERYRKGQQKKIDAKRTSAHDATNNAISAMEKGLHRAELTVEDAAKGEVRVTNKSGTVVIKMPVRESPGPSSIVVETVDSIDDGLLWEPSLIGTTHGLRLNTGHPYYHKVYVPNTGSGVTIRGLDSLMWALSEAELGTIVEATKRHFRDLRFEVSKLLRELVEDMPDPDLGDG